MKKRSTGKRFEKNLKVTPSNEFSHDVSVPLLFWSVAASYTTIVATISVTGPKWEGTEMAEPLCRGPEFCVNSESVTHEHALCDVSLGELPKTL